MGPPSSLPWTLLALLGRGGAAAVSVAASHLVSKRIGLASEPLSAGKELAPPPKAADNGGSASRPEGDGSKGGPAPAAVPSTTTTTAVPVVPTPSTTSTAPSAPPASS